jgi:putative flippase GtrA
MSEVQRTPLTTVIGSAARLARTGVKFGLVGAIGVLVNTATLTLLYQGAHVPLFAASLVAVELSIVSNFLLNDVWTFAMDRPTWRRFAKFNLATAGALAVTPSMLWLLVALHFHFLAANLLGIAAAAALNFTTSTLWVWKVPEGGEESCSKFSSPDSSSSRSR